MWRETAGHVFIGAESCLYHCIVFKCFSLFLSKSKSKMATFFNEHITEPSYGVLTLSASCFVHCRFAFQSLRSSLEVLRRNTHTTSRTQHTTHGIQGPWLCFCFFFLFPGQRRENHHRPIWREPGLQSLLLRKSGHQHSHAVDVEGVITVSVSYKTPWCKIYTSMIPAGPRNLILFNRGWCLTCNMSPGCSRDSWCRWDLIWGHLERGGWE